AMLARRHGAGAFGRGFLLPVALQAAHMGGRTERRIGKTPHPRWVRRDQLGPARVPTREHLMIGQASDQAGMDEAGPAHAGYMARRGIKALDVPDRFLRQRKVIGQEAAAVLLGEEAVEAP